MKNTVRLKFFVLTIVSCITYTKSLLGYSICNSGKIETVSASIKKNAIVWINDEVLLTDPNIQIEKLDTSLIGQNISQSILDDKEDKRPIFIGYSKNNKWAQLFPAIEFRGNISERIYAARKGEKERGVEIYIDNCKGQKILLGRTQTNKQGFFSFYDSFLGQDRKIFLAPGRYHVQIISRTGWTGNEVYTAVGTIYVYSHGSKFAIYDIDGTTTKEDFIFFDETYHKLQKFLKEDKKKARKCLSDRNFCKFKTAIKGKFLGSFLSNTFKIFRTQIDTNKIENRQRFLDMQEALENFDRYRLEELISVIEKEELKRKEVSALNKAVGVLNRSFKEKKDIWPVYITARPEIATNFTRTLLFKSFKLPKGPTVFQTMEQPIAKMIQTIKYSCEYKSKSINELKHKGMNFLIGFGNSEHDISAYRRNNIPYSVLVKDEKKQKVMDLYNGDEKRVSAKDIYDLFPVPQKN